MWEERTYWVYMLASGKYGTLYVGVTNSLARRIWQHKEKCTPGFTRKYGVDRLVWYRGYGEVGEAIHFEKQLKRWRREWKIQLIEEDNLNWDDLYFERIAPPETSCLWIPDSRSAPSGMTRAPQKDQGRARRARAQAPAPDAPRSPTDGKAALRRGSQM